jgi:hypothetical protein
LSHTNDIRNSSFSSDDAPKGIGILFTKLFEENEAKLAQKLVFATLLDNNGKPRRQIGGLLTDFGTLVVEPPKDRGYCDLFSNDSVAIIHLPPICVR